jgi:hypothetical protein
MLYASLDAFLDCKSWVWAVMASVIDPTPFAIGRQSGVGCRSRGGRDSCRGFVSGKVGAQSIIGEDNLPHGFVARSCKH